MRVKDIMTSNVITVGPDATVPEIAALLHEHRISAVPVVDRDGKILGIVSEGDLMRRPETGTELRRSPWLALLSDGASAQDYVKSHGHKASDIMTRNVLIATEDMPLSEVAKTLEEGGVKRLPVVRAGRLVGICSRADIVRALASTTRLAAKAASVTDEEIRRGALDAVDGQPWHGAFTSIIVQDGVVHIWGLSGSPAERDAYRVAMEGIPGVKGIVDHRAEIGAWMYQE